MRNALAESYIYSLRMQIYQGIAPSAIAITAVIVLFAAAPLGATQAQAGGWHHG